MTIRDPKFQAEHSKRETEISSKYVEIAENIMFANRGNWKFMEQWSIINKVNDRLNSRAINCNLSKIVVKEARAALSDVSHPELISWLELVIVDQELEAEHFEKIGWG